MDQLMALGALCFDIGVKRVDGTMILREGWGAKQVLKYLLWLRRENFNRGHIYVRPAGTHGLSLVDDLTFDAVARMKAEGFEPAAIIETSPGSQVWLKHGEVLDEVTSTRAAKILAERFGGDPGSADWRHFGRLAGFTNPKPNRRLESGLQPFARLLRPTDGSIPFLPLRFGQRLSKRATSPKRAATDANANMRNAPPTRHPDRRRRVGREALPGGPTSLSMIQCR